MRVLVTGREGQVARALSERAGELDFVFAARPELDLVDAASIEAAVERIRPDLIISAAAYTAVDAAEDEPALAASINAEAPGVLARAAAKIGARVLHLSTDYVFDGSLDRPWREDDATGPLCVYGATKLAGEQAVAASGATYAILRTSWIYSPFGNNFVRTMLRLAAERNSLDVVGDQIGCPTCAFDIADALITVVETWRRDPGHGADALYHFAGRGETVWADFARAVFVESARCDGPVAQVNSIPTSAYSTKARRPANSRLDCTRFAETFGRRAPSWQQSLGLVVGRLLA